MGPAEGTLLPRDQDLFILLSFVHASPSAWDVLPVPDCSVNFYFSSRPSSDVPFCEEPPLTFPLPPTPPAPSACWNLGWQLASLIPKPHPHSCHSIHLPTTAFTCGSNCPPPPRPPDPPCRPPDCEFFKGRLWAGSSVGPLHSRPGLAI